MKIICLSVGNNSVGWEATFSLLGAEAYLYKTRKVLTVGVALGDRCFEKSFVKKK